VWGEEGRGHVSPRRWLERFWSFGFTRLPGAVEL
jgi:hypothetical protein